MKRNAVLMVLVLLSVQLFAQKQSQVIDKVVAVVGKNIILQSDIENQYMQYRLQGGVQGGYQPMHCDILESMLFQKLMLNQAEMDSITVTDDQVDAKMMQDIGYYIAQFGSQEKMESVFGKTLPEIKEELRPMVRDRMLQEQVQNNIIQNVVVTPSEVKAFYMDMPQDSLPMVNAEYEIAQIVKRPPVSIDEKLEVKDRLYQIRKRILSGESSFSTMAILYSEDPGSAKKGGELGFVGKGEFAPAFETVAFNLRDGEISEVVETEFGFHIIQLIERRDDMVNCRHILLSAKVPVEALEKAQNELDSVAALVRNGEMTFDEACKKFSDDDSKNNGGYVTNAATGGNRLSIADLKELEQYYPEYGNLDFIISRLGENEISDPLPMTTNEKKDAFRLVMVKKKVEAHKANLTDDYNLIQGWALEMKKQQARENWIREKANKAYIRIDENFADCEFNFDWIQK